MNYIQVAANGAPNSFVRLVQENPQIAVDLMNGCGALLGLLVLLENRGDLPPELREIIRNNHRRDEGRSAWERAKLLEAYGSTDGCPECGGKGCYATMESDGEETQCRTCASRAALTKAKP